MAILIRKLVFLVILTCSTSLIAEDNLSIFCNIGQALPLFGYNSKTKSDNTFDIAKITDFAKSFSFGVDKSYKKNFGFTIGFLYREFEMDKSKLEKMHSHLEYNTISYIHHLSIHNNFSLYAGVFKEIKSRNVSFKPKFVIGYSIIRSDFAEVYQLNENYEFVRKSSYNFDIEDSIVLGLGSDLEITLYKANNHSIKFQMQSFLNYQSPKIKIKINESDYEMNSIKHYNETTNQVICTLYYSIGFVFEFSR